MAEAVKIIRIELDADTRKLIRGMNQANKAVNKTGKSMNKLQKNMKRLISGFVAWRALKGITNLVAGFEKSFANVTTLVDQSTEANKKMQDGLLDLAGELGTATELSEGLYQALSASIEPARAVKFIGEAAKFAKAALTDTRTSVDVLTTVINAYGLEAKDAAHISDLLFQTIKDGKITGEELSSSLGRLIPIAANTGVGLDQIGAAMATLTKTGIKADEAVVSLRQVLISVLKPGKEAMETAQRLGIQFNTAAIESMGLQKWLAHVKEKTKGSGEELARLFPNVRALTGVMNLAGKASEEYARLLGNQQNVMGNVDIAFEKQNKTIDAAYNAFKNKLAAAITKDVLPAMGDLAEVLRDPVLIENIVALASSLAQLAGILAKVAAAAIKAAPMIGGLSGAFQELEEKEKEAVVQAEAFQDTFEKSNILWKKTGEIIPKVTELTKEQTDAIKKEKEAREALWKQLNKELIVKDNLVDRYGDLLNASVASTSAFTKEELAAAALADEEARLNKATQTATTGTKTLSDAWADANARMELISKTASALIGIFNKLGIETDGLISSVADLGTGLFTAFTAKDPISKIGGIASAIGGLIDVAGDLFDIFSGDGIGEAMERTFNSGIELSKDMEESVRELADELGDTGTAISILADEIIKVGDVTTSNFADFAKLTQDILSQLDMGKLTAEQTAKELGQAFVELVSEAERLGVQGSQAMLDIIGDVKNRGLEVVEINEFIQKSLEKGLGGYKKIKSAMDDAGLEEKIKSLKDELGGLKEGSKRAEEVKKELSGWENKLIDVQAAQRIFGDLSIKTFEDMLSLEEKIADNQALINGIEGLGEALLGLSATEKLTESDFDKFQTAASRAFDELTKQGFTSSEALKQMAPLLSRLSFLQNEFGFQTDDATQSLIDMAKQEGLIGEIADPMQDMAQSLRELVDIFSNKMPDAVGKTADAMSDMFKDGKKAAEDMAKGIGESLDGIDFNVNVGASTLNSEFDSAAGGMDRIMAQDQNIRVHKGEGVKVTTQSDMQRGKGDRTVSIGDIIFQMTIEGGGGDDAFFERFKKVVKQNAHDVRKIIRQETG